MVTQMTDREVVRALIREALDLDRRAAALPPEGADEDAARLLDRSVALRLGARAVLLLRRLEPEWRAKCIEPQSDSTDRIQVSGLDGAPRVRGGGSTVADVLEALADLVADEAAESLDMAPANVRACLLYARRLVSGELVEEAPT